MCPFVHSAVCTRPVANRSRLPEHEKPFLGPGPSGVQGQSPWSAVSGAKPPEADSFFVFGYPKGGAIFHLTSKFRKLREPHNFYFSDVALTGGHSDSH